MKSSFSTKQTAKDKCNGLLSTQVEFCEVQVLEETSQNRLSRSTHGKWRVHRNRLRNRCHRRRSISMKYICQLLGTFRNRSHI
jgi:hypothetical protein